MNKNHNLLWRQEKIKISEIINVTDGNLSTHLSMLEEAGLISVEKSFRGKKPFTTLSITPEGRKRFAKYIRDLEKIINLGQNQKIKADSKIGEDKR